MLDNIDSKCDDRKEPVDMNAKVLKDTDRMADKLTNSFLECYRYKAQIRGKMVTDKPVPRVEEDVGGKRGSRSSVQQDGVMLNELEGQESPQPSTSGIQRNETCRENAGPKLGARKKVCKDRKITSTPKKKRSKYAIKAPGRRIRK